MMHFRRILVLALLMGLSMAALTGVNAEAARKVIVDMDSGADDTCALMLAASSPEVDILGVTVLVGNVDLEQGTRNALAALEQVGSDVPVYKGASATYDGTTIEAFSVYGKDGMGERDLIHPQGKAQEQDAIDFMLQTIRENPGEVEIIALGPATNIALAMDRDPETMRQVKRIWSLGTAGLGAGNASPVAEFNVYHDVLAYRRMLDFGVPTTIVGLDMCSKSPWTNAQFDTLDASGDVGHFIVESFSKLREFYASNGSADSVTNCDTTAMLCVVDPDFVKETISCHGSCQTDPGECYAQVVFYKEGFIYDVVKNDFDYNVTLVSDVDGENAFDRYMSRVIPGADK